MKKFKVELIDGGTPPEKSNKDDAGWDCYVRDIKVPKVDLNGEKFLDKPDQRKVIASRQLIGEDEVSSKKGYVLYPGDRVLCFLGFKIEVPRGYYTKLVPRSGLALWHGITIKNSPGTIDCGYRNEVGAIVQNDGSSNVEIEIGDRICQIIITKLPSFEIDIVESLSESERGENGFGSTGKK